MTPRRRRWFIGTIVILALVAAVGFGLWRWAVATGSAGTLEAIDARFGRSVAVRLADSGRYGDAANQNVELWVPEGIAPGGAWPLVVFAYGGGWHSGATADYRFVARTLGEHGFATALVGYRLVPEGRFPAMLEDTAAGVRWARDRAPKAGARADGIVLAGHSAGAYNVLMLNLDPQWLARAGVPESVIGGTVSLAGPADFFPFTSDSARNALGHAADPRATQPITFPRADAPPILLMHGTADTVVRVRNSRNLAKALRNAGGHVEELEFDGMGHAGIIMALSRPFAQGGKVLAPLVAFARKSAAEPRLASVPVQRETR